MTLCLRGRRDQKVTVELDFAADCVNQFDSIVPSEVGSRLSVYDFLAGRGRPLPVFLRVPELLQYPLAFIIDQPMHRLPMPGRQMRAKISAG
jgi:hypothetical protein